MKKRVLIQGQHPRTAIAAFTYGETALIARKNRGTAAWPFVAFVAIAILSRVLLSPEDPVPVVALAHSATVSVQHHPPR